MPWACLLYTSIVQIGLKRENNGTNDYSVATFKLLQDFQGEELAQIRAYANSFKEQIKLLLQQRAEITEEQRDTGCDYVIEPGAMTNEPADGHYTVSPVSYTHLGLAFNLLCHFHDGKS